MSFRLSMADNTAAFKKWHDRKHLGEWSECVYEPCSVTESQWRKAWSQA